MIIAGLVNHFSWVVILISGGCSVFTVFLFLSLDYFMAKTNKQTNKHVKLWTYFIRGFVLLVLVICSQTYFTSFTLIIVPKCMIMVIRTLNWKSVSFKCGCGDNVKVLKSIKRFFKVVKLSGSAVRTNLLSQGLFLKSAFEILFLISNLNL